MATSILHMSVYITLATKLRVSFLSFLIEFLFLQLSKLAGPVNPLFPYQSKMNRLAATALLAVIIQHLTTVRNQINCS